MNKSLLFVSLVCLLLSACTQVPSGPVDVANTEVFEERLLADSFDVFGVSLGDSRQYVHNLHGQPDNTSVHNEEITIDFYSLPGSDAISVSYTFDNQRVYSMEVSSVSRKHFASDMIFDMDREGLISMFGEPFAEYAVPYDDSEDYLEYDELGYVFSLQNNTISFVRFRSPNLFPEDPNCPLVDTPATDGLNCIIYRSACDVPDDWTVVDSC